MYTTAKTRTTQTHPAMICPAAWLIEYEGLEEKNVISDKRVKTNAARNARNTCRSRTLVVGW